MEGSSKGLLADRLRIALDIRKMKASELSRQSGVPKDYICRYLKGTCEPKNIALGKIANALHINPLWLLGFGEMELYSSKREEVKRIIDKMSDEDLDKLLKLIEIIK